MQGQKIETKYATFLALYTLSQCISSLSFWVAIATDVIKSANKSSNQY